MVSLGAREAIMTLPDGCIGCLQVDGERVMHRIRIHPRDPIAAVGAGDAFLAGFVASRYGGAMAADSLRFAVACGADATQRLGAGRIDPKEVDKLVNETSVEVLSEPAEVS
jgi:1-phosphofructokinase/tagatose 6-phosphate kinase